MIPGANDALYFRERDGVLRQTLGAAVLLASASAAALTMKHEVRLTVMFFALALMPLHASAADTADQAAIRQTMMNTWDKPDARLVVDPIVVVADRSVAGWTQGERGGRALLVRTHGQWHVVACAGDGLRDAKTLEMAGVQPARARELATALGTAEARLPASVRAKFSTFDGMVPMDGGKHP